MDWRDVLQQTPDCIDALRFGEELTPVEHAHVESCVRCQSELALFREMMAVETSPSSQWIAGRLRTSRQSSAAGAVGRRPSVAYAIAAMLVVLVGIAAWMRFDEPSIAIPTGTDVYRSARLEVIAPKDDVAQAPNELRWNGVPGATRYSVRILEVDATQVWSAETIETSVMLPREVSAQFRPGKLLRWSVSAYRNDELLAKSETQNVRVQP
jgi:hypothetical protein